MSDSELGYYAPASDLVVDPMVEFTPLVAGDGEEPGKGGATESNPESGYIGTVLPLYTNPDGSRSITGDRNVDAVLIGAKWGTTNITFSFPTAGSNYNGIGYDPNGVSNYFIALGPQQQAAARAAFAQLASLTGLTFTEITETDTVHANIRISQTGDNDAPSAYGGFPSDTRGVAGDIWFGRTSQPYYDIAYKGTWGFATIMHEIGHTMGLKHGHQDYTNSDLSGYFGTSPRFGTQSLTPDRDGQSWSLMTYTPAPFTNSNFAGEKINQPQSYQQYDVAALQYMYGANYNTNSGDSVYTFSQTTGEMFINGVGQGTPSGNKIYSTLWDGGGNDTIDASNYSNGVTIDLRPGEFSTLDTAQLANNLAYQNLVNLAPGNIAMSLLYNNDPRSLIENAKGGSGNDIFVGNVANNVLDGGAGSDTVIFTNTTGVSVTLNDAGTDVVVSHDGETDTLRSIENIQGTVGNDTLIGNSQNNTLSGGAGGTDTLSGGAGDDRLIGGGFTTVNNAIISKTASQSNLTTATAIDPQARNAFTLLSDSTVTNSTTLPHATVSATATGGGLEYYKINATAGSTAIFDIDGSTIDTWIELVNSDGSTILAQNDDSTADAGSSAGNSYLTYTFATAGTYYIRVGRWTSGSDTQAQALAAGTTYTLNISLSSATVNTAPISAINTSSASLDGGDGNDLLHGTLGNDTIAGGAGNDTASFATSFSNTAAGVTVDLNLQGGAQNTGAAGSDILTGIENLVGSQYNDTLTGDSGDNVIEGGLGNDTLTGGAGSDTASYAGAAAGVAVALGLTGAQNTVGAGTDTLGGFENLLGSAFNDSLTGDANANTLSGGAGDDTLDPGGNGPFVVDLLDGGAGSDTASFARYNAAVTATLNGAADGTATIATAAIATLRNIENLTGGNGADVLTGDSNANVIDGGLGDDTLTGGAGIDTVSFASRGSAGITVNLSTLTAQNTLAGLKTITGFENVRGTAGADNITGDGNDNTFFDNGGNDSYNGAAGSDTVDYSSATSSVTANLNTLTAQNTGTYGGTDTLVGIENLIGSATFANSLNGGNGTANRLVGGAAADFLVGNGQNDTLIGGAGNDVMFGDYVNSLSGAVGTADGDDVLEGGAGSDSLVGGSGNDILRGGDGDDILVSGIANGTVAGLSTVYTNDGGDDTFDGGDGTDTAYAYYTDHTGAIGFDLANLAGNSVVTVDGVAKGSFTSVERVIFRGGLGNDVVKGGGTLDTLVGNAGDDTLDGWYGNDTLSGGLGNDKLIGGEGLDTATYVNAAAGVTVDLRIQGVAQDTGGEGVDTLSSIEFLTGSNYGDTLKGDDGFNLIVDNAVSGPAGQTDSLFGFGGNDSLLVTRAAANVATVVNMDGGDGDDFIELRGGTLSTALAANAAGLSSATYLTLGATSNDRNVDTVTVDGGAGSDRIVLTGVASATVNAGSGADIVSISMRGASTVNNYLISLGSGADIIQFGVGATAAASTDVATTARTNRVTDFQAGDSGDKFEMTSFLNLGLAGYTANSNPFASGNMRLVQSGTDLLLQVDRDGVGTANGFVTVFAISNGYTGGFTAFNFDGFIGNLTLTGFAGDETITGATGNDTLGGGDGNDVLIGLAGNDSLDGGNGDDVLRGGAGDDTLIGGAGIDTASYGDAVSGVTVNLGLAGAQATGAGNDTLTGIENLTGSAFADTLTGDAGANRLEGGAGDDRLDGAAGADTMAGGLGDDSYVVDDAGDLVVEAVGEGTDTVTSAISYTLTANVENLVLTGTAANGTGNELANVITGNASDNALSGGAGNDTLIGNGGNDVLDGGAGADQMAGGTGDDSYVVDDSGDLVTEGSGEGIDRVTAWVSYALAANVENLLLAGAAVSGTGNELDNAITGNGLDNVLSGGAGNDMLFGNAGDDSLDGGVGADQMAGGTGNDSYFVDGVADVVVEQAGEGIDTVTSAISYTLGANVENLFLTGGATAGTGNGLDNVITGNELANTLSGGAGNDTLYGLGGNDVLDGGTGADKMYGGAGNDTYYVDNAGDQVVEQSGEGTDTVYASLNYTLTDNVENLFITGSALNGTGNALDNVITGNGLANILSGGGGNDILLGGAGNDTLLGGDGADRLSGGDGLDYLTGGAGNDTFAAEIGGGKIAGKDGMISVDVITDFVAGQDKIDLHGIDANSLQAGFQSFNWVGEAAGKSAGDLSMNHYGSMDAAEKALGMELDGVDGKSPFDGPVTVVFGNVDGGAQDFAMVLVGVPTLHPTDFQF